MIVVGALDVLFVATAIELLDIGASGAGFLSAAFGAGAIVGAASTVALVGRRRLTPSLAGGAVLFGAPIGLVAVAPSAVSAPVLFAAAGAGRSVGDVSGRTLLQRISPNDVLSRVFGVLEGLTMLALVIGSVGAAVLIETCGRPDGARGGRRLPSARHLALVGTVALDRPIRARRPTPRSSGCSGRSPSSRRSRPRRWSAWWRTCSRWRRPPGTC